MHWLLMTLVVAPALLSLGDQLQDYDPAQYAEVARRMLATHEWLTLNDALGPFTNKPPMNRWAQAAAMAVLGVTSTAARLPTLLFGLLALAATAGIGRVVWSPRTGALAAVLLGASIGFHSMVADPKVDMPVLAFSAVSVFGFVAARGRPVFVWLGWIGAGLATLSKGPVGLLLPLAAVGPETLRAAWQPNLRWWRRPFALRPVRGLIIVAALTVPFYVAVARANGADTALYLLVGQSFGRLTGASGYRDDTTPLFFLHTGLWAFAPFTAWLIIALVRRIIGLAQARTLPPEPARVAVWWLGIPFVAISLSLFKLPQYLYWLAAPAALLAADEVSRLSDVAASRWARAADVLGALALAGIGLALRFVFPGNWGWLAAAGAVIAVTRWLTRNASAPERATGAWVGVTSACLVFFHGHLHGALLAYQPWERVAGVVRAEEPQATEIFVTGIVAPHSLAFYAQRDLRHVAPEALAELVRERGPRLVVIGPDVSDAQLLENGLERSEERHFENYPTSVVHPAFLLHRTRADTLRTVRVAKISTTAR
ncbi:MAG: glycosyltransferase family 39 protein [Archangium sp.]|nr:glycosyltransferase family 39 protein [Archangium sp.]